MNLGRGIGGNLTVTGRRVPAAAPASQPLIANQQKNVAALERLLQALPGVPRGRPAVGPPGRAGRGAVAEQPRAAARVGGGGWRGGARHPRVPRLARQLQAPTRAAAHRRASIWTTRRSSRSACNSAGSRTCTPISGNWKTRPIKFNPDRPGQPVPPALAEAPDRVRIGERDRLREDYRAAVGRLGETDRRPDRRADRRAARRNETPCSTARADRQPEGPARAGGGDPPACRAGGRARPRPVRAGGPRVRGPAVGEGQGPDRDTDPGRRVPRRVQRLLPGDPGGAERAAGDDPHASGRTCRRCRSNGTDVLDGPARRRVHRRDSGGPERTGST